MTEERQAYVTRKPRPDTKMRPGQCERLVNIARAEIAGKQMDAWAAYHHLQEWAAWKAKQVVRLSLHPDYQHAWLVQDAREARLWEILAARACPYTPAREWELRKLKERKKF